MKENIFTTLININLDNNNIIKKDIEEIKDLIKKNKEEKKKIFKIIMIMLMIIP